MTITKQIRRGIEHDAFKAFRALKKTDENPCSYEIGECAREHIEKFAYMCDDLDREELLAHVRILGEEMTKFAQRLASGEKYYVHQEHMKEEIEERVNAFERSLLKHTPGPKP